MINNDIKTFRLRNRKLTKQQLNFINLYWPIFGLNFNKNNNLNYYFYNNPIVLDIGFGFGDSIIYLSKKYSYLNFVGIEVYIPGISCCLKNVHSYNLKNVKIFYGNAINYLKYYIKNTILYRVNIFFPDPWPKRRHYKRRIIQKNIIKKISKNLILNGFFHILTDSYSYFKHIQIVFNQFIEFKKISKKNIINFLKKEKIYTRFLNKAKLKKNKIYTMIYKKIF
ncbi:tRNA (guanosine(46)-N7)-methyltransferase TrmB [Buchnera aphidicola]|uniref:tRNA (guanosine(46)-N7)-methyltransferase TrmB n=1 Tax=Buchnera aphidicola TaxID=9 RepID=UPI0031B88838